MCDLQRNRGGEGAFSLLPPSQILYTFSDMVHVVAVILVHLKAWAIVDLKSSDTSPGDSRAFCPLEEPQFDSLLATSEVPLTCLGFAILSYRLNKDLWENDCTWCKILGLMTEKLQNAECGNSF